VAWNPLRFWKATIASRARAHNTIDFANLKTLALELGLDLPNLGGAQIDGSSAAAVLQSRIRRTNGHRRDDVAASVNDHDLITHDKLGIAAPLRINIDQRGGYLDDTNIGRHARPNVYRKGHVIDPRHVCDRRALYRGYGCVAPSWA
jgi:hypothetical protein